MLTARVRAQVALSLFDANRGGLPEEEMMERYRNLEGGLEGVWSETGRVVGKVGVRGWGREDGWANPSVSMAMSKPSSHLARLFQSRIKDRSSFRAQLITQHISETQSDKSQLAEIERRARSRMGPGSASLTEKENVEFAMENGRLALVSNALRSEDVSKMSAEMFLGIVKEVRAV